VHPGLGAPGDHLAAARAQAAKASGHHGLTLLPDDNPQVSHHALGHNRQPRAFLRQVHHLQQADLDRQITGLGSRRAR